MFKWPGARYPNPHRLWWLFSKNEWVFVLCIEKKLWYFSVKSLDEYIIGFSYQICIDFVLGNHGGRFCCCMIPQSSSSEINHLVEMCLIKTQSYSPPTLFYANEPGIPSNPLLSQFEWEPTRTRQLRKKKTERSGCCKNETLCVFACVAGSGSPASPTASTGTRTVQNWCRRQKVESGTTTAASPSRAGSVSSKSTLGHTARFSVWPGSLLFTKRHEKTKVKPQCVCVCVYIIPLCHRAPLLCTNY